MIFNSLARAARPPAASIACSSATSRFFGFFITATLKHCFHFCKDFFKHCLTPIATTHNTAMLKGKTLGERIDRALVEARVSKRAAADACGISPQAVSGWIRTSRISKENLNTLIRLTGRNYDYFVSNAAAQPDTKRNGGSYSGSETIPGISNQIFNDKDLVSLLRTWQDADELGRQILLGAGETVRKLQDAKARRRGKRTG